MSSITWDGWIWDYNSFAIVNRNIVCALHQLGVDVRLNAWIDGEPIRERFLDYDVLVTLAARQADFETGITIRQSWPVMAPYYNVKHNWSTLRGRLRIGFFIWECEHMPQLWIMAARDVDAIITISQFSSERVTRELQTFGVTTPVLTALLGVDRRLFHPAVPAASLAARSFRFLYVGTWQSRKGSDLLRQAYVEEFTDAEDVSLVVLSRGESSVQWTTALPPNAPHILVLDEVLETRLGGIYTASHCLVHPARLEGFGMTILEAMACGIPVLCADTGGQRAFADDHNAILLPTHEELFVFPFELQGLAYRVDVPALRDAMRRAVQGSDPARIANGLETARVFSWERCAVQILEGLHSIQKGESI